MVSKTCNRTRLNSRRTDLFIRHH
ncbi:hypothetical protein D037_0238A, partial [Vibrio parahaemolyticus IDH02640]